MKSSLTHGIILTYSFIQQTLCCPSIAPGRTSTSPCPGSVRPVSGPRHRQHPKHCILCRTPMPTALACVCSRNQGKLSVADTYGFRVAHISQIQKWVISESKCEETRTFLMPWFTSLEFFRQAEGMDREDCKSFKRQ